MKVILSIKPEYAAKILNGSKRFEFRKSMFDMRIVTSVLIYATKPIGKVVGEFEVKEIHVDTPGKIWKMTRQHAGVKKKFFDEYFRDRDTAVAIVVGDVHKFDEPLELTYFGPGLTAPQSFRYVATECRSQLSLKLT